MVFPWVLSDPNSQVNRNKSDKNWIKAGLKSLNTPSECVNIGATETSVEEQCQQIVAITRA